MTGPDSIDADLISMAGNTAIKLLARRDHSTHELSRKLAKRSIPADVIGEVLKDLQRSGYVDDARYARCYAEQRVNKGYGPQSVRAKLRERGLEEADISCALEGLQLCWSEHAKSVIMQRFDDQIVKSTDRKCESRIARFLLQRGFSGSDSLRALQAARRQLSDN